MCLLLLLFLFGLYTSGDFQDSVLGGTSVPPLCVGL
jgi:hypothetical protein